MADLTESLANRLHKIQDGDSSTVQRDLRTALDGRVIVGGEDEAFSDDEKRDALMPEKITALRRKLGQLMPFLDTRPEFTWAGCFSASPDAALSMAKSRRDSIAGRKVAVPVSNKVDGAAIDALRKELQAGGAAMKLIAPRLGDIKGNDGKVMKVDHRLPTVGSVLFDAVYVPGGQHSVEAPCADAHAVLFVKEAYKHGKAVGASDEGELLIAKAARSAGTSDGAFHGPGVIADYACQRTEPRLHRAYLAIATQEDRASRMTTRQLSAVRRNVIGGRMRPEACETGQSRHSFPFPIALFVRQAGPRL